MHHFHCDNFLKRSTNIDSSYPKRRPFLSLLIWRRTLILWGYGSLFLTISVLMSAHCSFLACFRWAFKVSCISSFQLRVLWESFLKNPLHSSVAWSILIAFSVLSHNTAFFPECLYFIIVVFQDLWFFLLHKQSTLDTCSFVPVIFLQSENIFCLFLFCFIRLPACSAVLAIWFSILFLRFFLKIEFLAVRGKQFNHAVWHFIRPCPCIPSLSFHSSWGLFRKIYGTIQTYFEW